MTASSDTGGEVWITPEEVTAARRRYEQRLPGYEHPAAYGVARLDGQGITFGQVNGVDSIHRLPAVILASVCGHRAGTATYPLGAPAMDEAIRRLSPAEPCLAYDHPNLWSWRTLRASADDDASFVAIFVSDLDTPPVDEVDAAFRRRLRVQG